MPGGKPMTPITYLEITEGFAHFKYYLGIVQNEPPIKSTKGMLIFAQLMQLKKEGTEVADIIEYIEELEDNYDIPFVYVDALADDIRLYVMNKPSNREPAQPVKPLPAIDQIPVKERDKLIDYLCDNNDPEDLAHKYMQQLSASDLLNLVNEWNAGCEDMGGMIDPLLFDKVKDQNPTGKLSL